MTTLADIPLSMLDLVPVRTGGSVAEALHNSLDLARHVERLGFNRFWLAEHHNMDGIASSATALLIGHIAGGTSRIRVGSGGVMLPNHAPLVVAENFGTLETLYPGRIDLGLGRAPADQATMRALRRDRLGNGDDFPSRSPSWKCCSARAVPSRACWRCRARYPGADLATRFEPVQRSPGGAERLALCLRFAFRTALPARGAAHLPQQLPALGGTRQTLRDDRRAADRRTYRRRGRVPRHYRLPARAGADPRRA